jgi:D-3-phosphoglycerate dehydrogenase
MKRYNTVITATIVDEYLNKLKDYCDIKVIGWGKTGVLMSEEELEVELKEAEIFIVGYEMVSESLLKKLNKLKVIACTRSNPVNIDLKATVKLGIPVIYTPGRNSNSAAEFTMGLLLSEVRNISRAFHALKKGEYVGKEVEDINNYVEKDDVVWNLSGESPYKKFKGYELSGRTIGFIGLGNIAIRLVNLCKAFNMNIAAYDPYCCRENAERLGVKLLDLNELLGMADFVSINCKVSPETKGLIGKEQLSMMKSSAYLINTARASIIVQDALIDALTNKKIAGAALDVFWDEPIPSNHPLLQLDNVTITPHLAGASKDVPRTHSMMVVSDIIAWINGEKPVRVI